MGPVDGIGVNGVGCGDGTCVGRNVGSGVGSLDGLSVGTLLGAGVGEGVGCGDGAFEHVRVSS